MLVSTSLNGLCRSDIPGGYAAEWGVRGVADVGPPNGATRIYKTSVNITGGIGGSGNSGGNSGGSGAPAVAVEVANPAIQGPTAIVNPAPLVLATAGLTCEDCNPAWPYMVAPRKVCKIHTSCTFFTKKIRADFVQ